MTAHIIPNLLVLMSLIYNCHCLNCTANSQYVHELKSELNAKKAELATARVLKDSMFRYLTKTVNDVNEDLKAMKTALDKCRHQVTKCQTTAPVTTKTPPISKPFRCYDCHYEVSNPGSFRACSLRDKKTISYVNKARCPTNEFCFTHRDVREGRVFITRGCTNRYTNNYRPISRTRCQSYTLNRGHRDGMMLTCRGDLCNSGISHGTEDPVLKACLNR